MSHRFIYAYWAFKLKLEPHANRSGRHRRRRLTFFGKVLRQAEARRDTAPMLECTVVWRQLRGRCTPGMGAHRHVRCNAGHAGITAACNHYNVTNIKNCCWTCTLHCSWQLGPVQHVTFV